MADAQKAQLVNSPEQLSEMLDSLLANVNPKGLGLVETSYRIVVVREAFNSLLGSTSPAKPTAQPKADAMFPKSVLGQK